LYISSSHCRPAAEASQQAQEEVKQDQPIIEGVPGDNTEEEPQQEAASPHMQVSTEQVK